MMKPFNFIERVKKQNIKFPEFLEQRPEKECEKKYIWNLVGIFVESWFLS